MIEHVLKPKDDEQIMQDIYSIECPVDKFVYLFIYEAEKEFKYTIFNNDTHHKLIRLAKSINDGSVDLECEIKKEVNDYGIDSLFTKITVTKENYYLHLKDKPHLILPGTKMVRTIKLTDHCIEITEGTLHND